MRYYYKSKDGKGLLNLKTPDFDNDPNYERITEKQWNKLVNSVQIPEPTAAELHRAEVESQIAAHKAELRATDYIACKLAECDTAEERAAIKQEYATQLARRVELRGLINTLESELN